GMKYSVRAAAMATGITESRLRTWERRYGIPQPRRSTNGRRQYEERDLGVIRRMTSLVAAGVPASEAAEVARLEGPIGLSEAAAAPQPENPLVARIVGAASRYDELSLVLAVREAYVAGDWATALDQVVFPALRSIGEKWGDDEVVSANEHFATELIRRELYVEIARQSPVESDGALSVLLACPEGERHDVGLLALYLMLIERGIRVIYLGADVPVSDLAHAVLDLRPEAVCLSATLATSLTSLRRSMRALISAHSGSRLYVGGPALASVVAARGIPAVLLPVSMAAATDVLASAAI
ncbi:MAG: cobalamin-dependent protein, partial [Acidobacteriota bacterium]